MRVASATPAAHPLAWRSWCCIVTVTQMKTGSRGIDAHGVTLRRLGSSTGVAVPPPSWRCVWLEAFSVPPQSKSVCFIIGRLIRWRSMFDVDTLRTLGGGQLGPWARREEGRPKGRSETPWIELAEQNWLDSAHWWRTQPLFSTLRPSAPAMPTHRTLPLFSPLRRRVRHPRSLLPPSFLLSFCLLPALAFCRFAWVCPALPLARPALSSPLCVIRRPGRS